MSQHEVDIKRGHRTNTIILEQAANERAKVYSSSMPDGETPMVIVKNRVLVPTIITDEPMGLDALSALDQLAMNYSNSLKATPTLSSQGTEIHDSRGRSSASLQHHSTEQRENVAPQYLPRDAEKEIESLQLVDSASLQNEVGHGADVTNQINGLGGRNNVESISEHMAEAYSDVSGEMIKRTAATDSNLWMVRPLGVGVNEGKVSPVKQRPGKKAARKPRHKTLQGKFQKKEIQHDLSKLKGEHEVSETGDLKTSPQKQPHRRMSRRDSKIAALQRGRPGARARKRH